MIRLERADRFGGPLREPIGSARAPLFDRAGMILTLVDEQGRLGLGEASPLPGLSRETLADVESTLGLLALAWNEHVPRDLVSVSAADLTPAKAKAFCDALESATLATKKSFAANGPSVFPPSLRFGLEAALSDLASRARGVSVADWLSNGSTQTKIERSVLSGAIDQSELLTKARAHVSRGARTLKVKVSGNEPDKELDRLLALRSMLDELTRGEQSPMRIRLDLNGALDVRAAKEALAIYARANIELVEEPVRDARLLDLGRTEIPWFADESLADPKLARALLSVNACAGFVLKPTLLGLFESHRLALEATGAGKRVIVTHTFDGPVALAAACELALSLPKTDLAQGLDIHPALQVFPAITIPQLEDPVSEDGSARRLSISATEQLGLGVAWVRPR